MNHMEPRTTKAAELVGRRTKTTPPSKTCRRGGDCAKAAAVTVGAQAGRPLKYPVRPRHGLVEPLAARGRNAATLPAPSRCRPSNRAVGIAPYRFRSLAATAIGTMGR
ncbi:hypothetical protein GTC254T_01660 [Burkholderia pseudomallei]|nr:hypothetical protein GTC054_01640 [Burkholderia pseudomallei]BEH35071.1 hypothetical protein GTC254T_01660 [Burkholderia pseudomallei]